MFKERDFHPLVSLGMILKLLYLRVLRLSVEKFQIWILKIMHQKEPKWESWFPHPPSYCPPLEGYGNYWKQSGEPYFWPYCVCFLLVFDVACTALQMMLLLLKAVISCCYWCTTVIIIWVLSEVQSMPCAHKVLIFIVCIDDFEMD